MFDRGRGPKGPLLCWPFILLTIDKWLDNPRTAELLKRYFSTEIRTINKDMKAGKYDWKIVAAPENK